MSAPVEQWKPVPDWAEYEVSDHGRVRRALSARSTRAHGVKALSVTGRGYARVGLHQQGRRKKCKVHRLVAFTFIGPPPSTQHEVAHWDGNKLNNHVSNLRWATSAENKADGKRLGRDNGGERNGRSRLTAADVRMIRALRGRQSALSTARQFGVSGPTVYAIWSYKTWRHVA